MNFPVDIFLTLSFCCISITEHRSVKVNFIIFHIITYISPNFTNTTTVYRNILWVATNFELRQTPTSKLNTFFAVCMRTCFLSNCSQFATHVPNNLLMLCNFYQIWFLYNRKILKLTVCTGRKHLGSEQKSCDMSIVLVITYSCDEGAQATEQFSWLPSLSCSRYTTTSAISYSNTVGYKWKKVVKTQRHDLLKLIKYYSPTVADGKTFVLVLCVL